MNDYGPIAYARADLAQELEALLPDIPVHTSLPGRINPPCIVLAEQSPLLTPGDAWHEVIVHLEAAIIAQPVEHAIDQLDDLTDQVVTGLWDTLQPTAAGYTTITAGDGQTYLVSRITIDSSPILFT